MRPRILSAAVACALLATLPNSAVARDYKDEIAGLVQWACEQGKYTGVDQPAAILLGFPNASPAGIPVLRKAYQDNETRIIYAFNIFTMHQVPTVIMFRTTTILSTLWLISEDGRILRAAEATKTKLRPVPVDRYPDYFTETKDYLLKERRKALAEKALTGQCQDIPEFTGK